MLYLACDEGCAEEAMIICAMLSVERIFYSLLFLLLSLYIVLLLMNFILKKVKDFNVINNALSLNWVINSLT